VGVNKFQVDEPPPRIFQFDPAVAGRQLRRLSEVRSSRDPQAASAALDRVESAARSGENLMPVLIEAVGVYATVGEIVSRLKRVFGSYEAGAAGMAAAAGSG
jgi:methylmalonyl-CoA mutase N-terminal domain/subunit